MNKKIFVHVCCGVCGAYVVEKLQPEFGELRLYYYNPNIYPREEYNERLEMARQLSKIYGVTLEEGPYEPAVWDAAVQGYETEPERGKRAYGDKRVHVRSRAHG